MESRCYWLSWALLWWGIVSPPLVCKSVPTWIQHCSAQGPEHRFQAWLPKILLRGGDWDKYGRRRNTAAEMLWHFDKSYARRFQKLALWFKKKKKKKQAPFPLAFYFLLIIQYSFQFGAWSTMAASSPAHPECAAGFVGYLGCGAGGRGKRNDGIYY